MPRQDTVDFFTAFAIGTVLGIGATLLMQPAPVPARKRIVKQLKPYRKKMGKSYSQVRSGVQAGAGATSEMSSEVISAGRELISDFREEVAKILGEAREDLREMVEDGAEGVTKRTRKARRSLGM